MEVHWEPGSPEDVHYRRAMRNYCVLDEIVSMDDDEQTHGVTDPDGYFNLSDIQPAGRPKTPAELGKSGPQTVEQKRIWRKLQALRQVRWFNPKSFKDSSDIAKVRAIYLKTMIVNQRINALGDLIRQSEEYDWMTVKEKTPGVMGQIG